MLCAGSQGLRPDCSLGGLAPHCPIPHRPSGGRTGCRGCLDVPHRTCRTATTSCRLHWKACEHSCPRVGMAGPTHSQRNGCPLDTGQQVGAQSREVTACVLLLWESRGWWQGVSVFPHCTSFPLVPGDSAGGGPAARHVRPPRDHMPFGLPHVGEGPVTQGQGQYPEAQGR